MKKTLLLASSNEFLFKKLTTLLLFTALILGTGWSGFAQTITPVEKYHSIDATASMTTQGWTSNLFAVSSTASR